MIRMLLPALGLALIVALILAMPGRSSSSVVSKTPLITLEEIRKVADLVMLRVPLQRIAEARLDGFTGGLTVLLVVHGEGLIATDLLGAEIKIDERARTVSVVLPPPRVLTCRLDHRQTAIVHLSRHGAWMLLPGPAGEGALIERAFRDAQNQLREAVSAPEKMAAARSQAEQVLRRVVEQRGLSLRLSWRAQ